MTKELETVLVYSQKMDIGMDAYVEYYPDFLSESLIRLGLECLSVKIDEVKISENGLSCEIVIIYDGSEKDYRQIIEKMRRFFSRRFHVDGRLFDECW